MLTSLSFSQTLCYFIIFCSSLFLDFLFHLPSAVLDGKELSEAADSGWAEDSLAIASSSIHFGRNGTRHSLSSSTSRQHCSDICRGDAPGLLLWQALLCTGWRKAEASCQTCGLYKTGGDFEKHDFFVCFPFSLFFLFFVSYSLKSALNINLEEVLKIWYTSLNLAFFAFLPEFVSVPDLWIAGIIATVPQCEGVYLESRRA